MFSLFSRRPGGERRGLLGLWLLLLLVAGCGDSQDYVFTGTANNGPNPPGAGNTLTVNLDTSVAVNPRISAEARSFEVTLFDAELAEIESQTVARGGSVSFGDLPDGTYTVRVVGLDAAGNPVGYFDRTVVVDDDGSVLIEGLVYTSNIPAIGSTDTPFMIFTELPDALSGGQSFRLQVAAFDANGAPLTSASGSVALSATGLTLSAAPAPAVFNNGVATFNGLSFPEATDGSVTFAASNSTLGTATTPSIEVSPTAPELGRLEFSAVPENAVAGENFTSGVQVQVFDENDELETDPVQVSLSLNSSPTPPAGGSLSGPTTATSVNGVATFSGLSLSEAGSYALRATADGYEAAVSGPVQVDEAPFSRLAVADYDEGRIFIYEIEDLQDAVNNVAPTVVLGNLVDTDNNYDLASAGPDALWFCAEDSPLVQLYTELETSSTDGPSRYLNVGAESAATLTYDEQADILYVGEYDVAANGYGVSIFDDALDLPNLATRTRRVFGFPSYVTGVVFDPATDRLFVVCRGVAAQAGELHLFENVSDEDFDGDIDLIAHQVTTFNYPSGSESFDLTYDAEHERLYLGSYISASNIFYYLDDVNDLGASTTISSNAPGPTNTYASNVLYDSISSVLYVADYDNGRVLIYDDPDATLTATTGAVAPDRLLQGAATMLDGPSGITLLP